MSPLWRAAWEAIGVAAPTATLAAPALLFASVGGFAGWILVRARGVLADSLGVEVLDVAEWVEVDWAGVAGGIDGSGAPPPESEVCEGLPALSPAPPLPTELP